jgi:hypothetical protein
MTARDFLGRILKVGDYIVIKAGKHVGKKGRVLKIRQGGVGMWADVKLDLLPSLRLEKRCPNLQIIPEVKG